MHDSNDYNTPTIQRAFASFCKGEKTVTMPRVSSPSGADTYSTLIKSIFHNALVKAYPITHADLSSEQWDLLLTEFIKSGTTQSPYMWKMPYDFYTYTTSQDLKQRFPDKPYLIDLLGFEWIEIEVYMMEDQEIPSVNTPGLLFANPHFTTIELSYPVFAFKPPHTLDKKGSYNLVCFRNLDTDKVRFVEIAPFFIYVLESLKERPRSPLEVIQNACSAFELDADEHTHALAKNFFLSMSQQGLLVNT